MEHETCELSLHERVALITGGSAGIGFETARLLGLRGAQIAICAKEPARLAVAAAQLTSSGIPCLSITADVKDPSAADHVIDLVSEHYGALDVLINNAGGIDTKGNFFDLTNEDWEDCFNLNLFSAVRFSKLSIPLLRKSAAPRIINISSVTARQPGSFNPHYSAAKLALLNFSKHLSNILAPDKILVNSVSPGIIHTDGWDDYLQEKASASGEPLEAVTEVENARAIASMPLKRFGAPAEVASVVLFLASEAASFITGADIVIDGGKIKGL
jgi:3-oxoacyl-[acyl-carrier protein] reductase